MDRVIVITGGTRGIGVATARLLAGPGTALVLGYRADHSAARAIVAELHHEEHPVLAVAADLSDPEQIPALFEAADEFGDLTGLVNNAGMAEPQTSFTGINADRWQRVLAANVIGTAICCREAVQRMQRHGRGGSIVNISSRAAVLGSPHEYVDYAASKAAVDTLTRGLALEVAGEGIRVNAVRPGTTDTDFHAAAGDPDRAHRLAPSQPMGRCGRPEEVAEAILWLLSERSSFTTGTTMDVSGGR